MTEADTADSALKPLNVGLLLCDDVDPEYREEYGTYTEMFARALDAERNRLVVNPIRAFEGEALPEPASNDAYVITGSRYGVYEDRPWIADLMAFVRQCWEQEIRMVGICFGHQLIAHALGGETRKADVGWGFGIHSARLSEHPEWMTDRDQIHGDMYNLVVIHQDQVVDMPPGFRAIASNDFCPNSMIVADGRMLGIQGHPEFSKAFCEFRARYRRELIGEETFQETLRSLEGNDLHSATVMKWVNNFLRQ